MRWIVLHRLLSRKSITILCLGGLVCGTRPPSARALEPLDAFLASASTRAFDVREASARSGEQAAEAHKSRGKLLPRLSATGRALYNQYEIKAQLPERSAVITPQFQRDLQIQATLPLIDIAAVRQLGASKDAVRAADADLTATHIDVQRATARDYYALVAAEALSRAAQRTLGASERNLTWVKERVAAGVASELDQRRAEAEVERNRQLLSEADYQRALARRALETLTGKTPSEGAPALAVALDPEPALEVFSGEGAKQLPSVVGKQKEAQAADKRSKAARGALYPSVDAVGTQTFTNATGFGEPRYYSVGVSATFRLDASAFAALSAERARARIAHVRAERSERAALDAIHDAWFDVARQIEKSRAARSELEAARLAVRIARDRYGVGTATFLDVVLAERDELSADARAIEADANLCRARADLRLLSGRALESHLCGATP